MELYYPYFPCVIAFAISFLLVNNYRCASARRYKASKGHENRTFLLRSTEK